MSETPEGFDPELRDVCAAFAVVATVIVTICVVGVSIGMAYATFGFVGGTLTLLVVAAVLIGAALWVAGNGSVARGLRYILS